MKFNFEVPEPLQLSAPVSYYEDLLSDYRYRDISFLKMSTTGQVLGECVIGGINYTIKSYETAGLITSIEILDARETDSFLDIPLSLSSRKFVKALKDVGIEFEHNRDGITIPHDNGAIALSYQFGKVVAICWE
ncbi:hypothetical protein NLL38_08490 [Corynebacterium accolens]|jgi:hypothetical protein|uniref:hypothetical protein n=1 Tax=Corynebacterium accolens TaxID=38284 RepID=UPI0025439B80|nr:hypothetical protein [Corynebacterium accolens]MDK4268940.1 hypothetical protein [Corynebacterium accolens]MDK4293605.1 hypothetical protein [Corynebacterium accolens]MDK8498941.1 hypothetical protein [Corynebacterium accolens]MDK8505762.1 hypothetical protein [Corynebacterium accolens]MDK8594013.1 hypothetical protein [Corynebacterium accolens]